MITDVALCLVLKYGAMTWNGNSVREVVAELVTNDDDSDNDDDLLPDDIVDVMQLLILIQIYVLIGFVCIWWHFTLNLT